MSIFCKVGQLLDVLMEEVRTGMCGGWYICIVGVPVS